MEEVIREYVNNCLANGLSEEAVVESVRSVYAAERNARVMQAIEALTAQGFSKSQILNMTTIWGSPTLGEIVTILELLEDKNINISGGR